MRLLVLLALLPSAALAAPLHSVDVERLALSDAEDLGLGGELVLEVERSLRWGGGTFVRLAPRHGDLPVYGADVVISYDDDLAPRDIFGPVGVTLPPLVAATVTADQALATARAWADEEGDGEIKLALADDAGDFFFEPDPLSLDDPFAEVQMFFHLSLVAQWFDDEFGFRTDYGLGGDAVEGIVNFELENAFYGDADGDGVPEVAFGQGGGRDFAYDADVVYHEFGHAVFGSVVDTGNGRYDEYGRLTAPSALNEGSADLFSLVLTGDPQLGEYSGGGVLGDGAIRDLEADRHCPTDIYGESHADGEIWGSFGWNLIDEPLVGANVTAHLIFGALNRWDDEVTFASAGVALRTSADDLLETGFIDEATFASILDHMERSGLDDCGRVIPLDEGPEPTQALRGRNGNNGPRLYPIANQLSLDAPEGTVALRFYVEELFTTNPELGYRVHVQRGGHIVHVFEEDVGGGGGGGGGGWRPPTPEGFDFSVDGFEAGLAVELTADSNPPLVPGATYYFSILGNPSEDMQGGGFAEITLRGEADIVPVEEAPIDGGDGCQNCSSTVGGGSAPSTLALLGLIAIARRRRL